MADPRTFQVNDWVKISGPGITCGRRFTRRIGRVLEIDPNGAVLVVFSPDVLTYQWDLFWPAALEAYQPSRQKEAAWLIATLSA